VKIKFSETMAKQLEEPKEEFVTEKYLTKKKGENIYGKDEPDRYKYIVYQ
jgi:hypothetical protein